MCSLLLFYEASKIAIDNRTDSINVDNEAEVIYGAERYEHLILKL